MYETRILTCILSKNYKVPDLWSMHANISLKPLLLHNDLRLGRPRIEHNYFRGLCGVVTARGCHIQWYLLQTTKNSRGWLCISTLDY